MHALFIHKQLFCAIIRVTWYMPKNERKAKWTGQEERQGQGPGQAIACNKHRTRCTETFSVDHQNGLFSKLILMINWFLILISICFWITGTYFVLQNSFFKSYICKFQCIFEFSAIMQFFVKYAQRRFCIKLRMFLRLRNIFPSKVIHKPPWEKYS